MSGKRRAETFDATGNVVTLPPHKIDLRNASAIRRELGAVYRDMRGGKIDPADGTKLAFVLNLLRQAYETEKLEARLDTLESGMDCETRKIR